MHKRAIAVTVGAATCLVFFLSSTALKLRDVSAQDAVRVSEVCLDCHDDVHDALFGSPHQILPSQLDQDEALVACTDCHLGDSRHWEDDPDDYPMPSLKTADVEMVTHVCSTCHVNSHQQNMQEKNLHARNDVTCLGCHQVHDNTRQGLLKDSEPSLCYECHSRIEGHFAKPYRHPVADGVMKCSECHMSVDENRMELSYDGTNVACYQCHQEYQGPFPFEHQATVDYSTHEGACLTCHEAHGGYNPRMLKRPYEPPHYNLCSQCHSVPRHNQNVKHGSAWAGVPCNDCHVDIHGSYTSKNLLSPSLNGQGCINAGCHQS